jgi:hypothetical protein
LFAPSVMAHGFKQTNPNHCRRKTFEHRFLSHPKIWRPKHALDPGSRGHPATVLYHPAEERGAFPGEPEFSGQTSRQCQTHHWLKTAGSPQHAEPGAGDLTSPNPIDDSERTMGALASMCASIQLLCAIMCVATSVLNQTWRHKPHNTRAQPHQKVLVHKNVGQTKG